MLNREVRCSDWFLAKIEQANITDFDVQFREVIGDRRDKKLRSDRCITGRWSGQKLEIICKSERPNQPLNSGRCAQSRSPLK